MLIWLNSGLVIDRRVGCDESAWTFLIVALLVTWGAAQGARAQEPQSIGVFNDWVAYTYQAGGEKICYIGSQPTKDEGAYSDRGDIWGW